MDTQAISDYRLPFQSVNRAANCNDFNKSMNNDNRLLEHLPNNNLQSDNALKEDAELRLRHINDYLTLSAVAAICFPFTGAWALIRSLQARDCKNPNNPVCWVTITTVSTSHDHYDDEHECYEYHGDDRDSYDCNHHEHDGNTESLVDI
ncbi:hypothetical protein GJ496_005022 [Pomphorhynchus laevis]|nr:hypothetical protein GJ496_005022 [Pomphorhynchus laevis]